MSDVLEQTGGDDAGSGPGRDVTATSGPVVENEPTERSAQETRVRGGAAATPESSEDADAEGAAPDEDEDEGGADGAGPGGDTGEPGQGE